jgi:hypothetical protein
MSDETVTANRLAAESASEKLEGGRRLVMQTEFRA